MEKYDERDTMFARMGYLEGTRQYEDYYSKNPEKKEIDDSLRNMPGLCEPGTPSYEAEICAIADSNFRFLSRLNKLAEGEVNPNRIEVEENIITKKIKGLAGYFGADLVGVAKMKPLLYYSHRGRHKEIYGKEVEENYPYGIVIAVRMNKEFIGKAPMAPEVVETSEAYVKIGLVSLQIAHYIRELGYNARSHLDGNYLTILPVMGKEAGLGEIGRHGLLITPEYGPMVRLGAITTDMPLVTDSDKNFPIHLICNICRRCSDVCPGRAIPSDIMKPTQSDEKRLRINQERCYSFWRKVGTDCGVCLNICPFSHGLDIREIVNAETERPSEKANEMMDDYNKKYGMKPNSPDLPDWML